MRSLLQRRDFAGSFSRFWQGSYAPDYMGLGFIIIVDAVISKYVKPFHTLFRISDPRLRYPHAAVEHVPIGWLFAFALGIPLVVFTFWAFTFRPPLHKVHVTYLGLFISIACTVFVTDVVKNAVGRPRPDIVARCAAAQDTPPSLLSAEDVCTQADPHILHDGWRSFPSGHSSFSFSGLGFLYFFFAGQFRIFHPNTTLPAVLVTLSPILLALLIAISRLEDYRHDVYDVSAGTLLGFITAWASYRRYYPKLSSSKCQMPWPSNSELVAAALRWSSKKPQDEESLISRHTQAGNGEVRVPDIVRTEETEEGDRSSSRRPRTPTPRSEKDTSR